MATESDLRDLLQGPEPEGGVPIDVDAVVSRARRRRRPKVIAAQALGSVALVGGLFTAVAVGVPAANTGVLMSAEDAGGQEMASAPSDSDSYFAPTSAWTLQSCGAPVADTEPAENGLTLDVEPLSASAGSDEIPVMVTMHNDSERRVVGTTVPTPVLTLSADGVVIWHTTVTALSIVVVDLEPGETMTYPASITPVVCGSEDQLTNPASDLPAAGPGSYELRAAIDFIPDDEAAGPAIVTGPAAPVVLR